MKPVIMGTISLTFSLPIDHTNRNLAIQHFNDLINESIVEKIEMTLVNLAGERTTVKVEDWNISADDVFDENGIPL